MRRRQFVAAPLVLAAMFALGGCRGLCAKPHPVLKLVYQPDAGAADAPVQVKEVMSRRLKQLGVSGATVEVHDGNVEVGLPPLDADALADVMAVLSRRGKLEFTLVDDQDDFVEKVASSSDGKENAAGVEFRQEIAHLGSDGTGSVHYAVAIDRAGESVAAGKARLEAFFKDIRLPADRTLACGEMHDWDAGPAGGSGAPHGWRTYLLFAHAELGNDQIQDANARKDTSSQWTVALHFTAESSTRFERLTKRNVKRRLAIVLDGIVESAPLIMAPISGGYASITMGKATAENQEADARQLAQVLQSGALPVNVALASEERIPP